MNKFYIASISEFPKEEEVILYPYFTFKILYIRPHSNDTDSNANKNFNIPVVVV